MEVFFGGIADPNWWKIGEGPLHSLSIQNIVIITWKVHNWARQNWAGSKSLEEVLRERKELISMGEIVGNDFHTRQKQNHCS